MRDMVAILIAWGLGSVVWGVVLGRTLYGADPRSRDNPGASGSFRTFGPAFGVAVGLLDLLKGWGAVAVAGALGASVPGMGWAAIAVVGGHNWPVWFGFRGGGGLATAAGALVALGWRETLTAIAVALVVAATYKHPRLYGRLPMAALPVGALVGLPLLTLLFWRTDNEAGLVAATGCTLVIGLRGLQMLAVRRRAMG